MKIILLDNEALTHQVQQTIGNGNENEEDATLLYNPYDHLRAVAKTIELMQSEKKLRVYPLPATVETLLTSKVLTMPSAQKIIEDSQDAWDFLIQNAPVEDVLTLLATRAHLKLRLPGEFDSVIDRLARRSRLRRRALRIMYGKIRKQLFPSDPTTTRPRYPWWKHLKRKKEKTS